MKPNENYRRLKENYLFSEVALRVTEFVKNHPEKKIIRMGIGDVTQPLCAAAVEAMKQAAENMGKAATFHGYGPEQGYEFLREKIRDYYTERKIELSTGEIFVSDGAKSDLGNFLELFDRTNTVLIPDPVYPVYMDSNIMDGRKIFFADANADNGFLPMPGETAADIIFICSPNNPTGAVYTREQLKAWVDFANRNGSIILFDGAYEAFVCDCALPRSIYEIEGAKSCAVEFCSLSKTAGFTGTRCGYTIVPAELEYNGMSINKMWLRRQSTKFNGVSYIVQRGAEAVFTPEGRKQIAENINYYRKNAEIIADSLEEVNVKYTGGRNSPYIWLRCPDGTDSWNFFDTLLNETGVVGTPGAGFGENGMNYFRLTAFSSRESTAEAMGKLKKLFRAIY